MHPSPLLPHVSASQIEKFLRCPRQWWLRYRLGEPEPETEAQRVGKAMHAALERWWEEGVQPSDPLALAALAVLPSRCPSRFLWEVEREFPEDRTLAGTQVKGFIDLILLDGQDGAPNATILDYKTTAGWEWAKSEEELRTNLQLTLYAWDVFLRYPQLRAVTTGHVAVHKRQRVARLTTTEMTRSEVFERVEQIERIVRRMQADWQRSEAPPALAPVPACEMFGGCPHRSDCFPYTSTLTGVLHNSHTTHDPMTQTTSPTDRLRALIASRNSAKAQDGPQVVHTTQAPPVTTQGPPRKPCSWVPPDAQEDLEPRPLDLRPLSELATWPKAATEGAKARGLHTVCDLLTFIAYGGTLTDIKGMGAKAAPKVQGELDRVAPLWPTEVLHLRRACDRFVDNNVGHPAAQAAQALRRSL